MSPVRIVTDSACDLSPDVTDAARVEVVPLTIRFGDDEFVDRVELSVDQFYERLARSAQLPETAACSPGQFEETFRKLAAEGASAIVCIDMSSDLSATMQSAQLASKAVEGDIDVRVVDSRSVSLGLGTQVLAAADAASTGASADEIVAMVEDMAQRTRVYGTLDTLENLKKGGRIGNARAFLGTLLSFKPGIEVRDGVVHEAGRPRTRRKALQWLADKVLSLPDVENLYVMHGNAPDLEEFLALLAPRFARDDIRVALVGAVIGTHGGPRVMGVTFQLPRGSDTAGAQ
jgi:DegV family protein with EDD domain